MDNEQAKEIMIAYRDRLTSSCSNQLNSDIEAFDLVIKVLQERPLGKWLPNYVSQFFNPGRSCSLCNKTVEFSENFCPNCGADMRGDTDGKNAAD